MWEQKLSRLITIALLLSCGPPPFVLPICCLSSAPASSLGSDLSAIHVQCLAQWAFKSRHSSDQLLSNIDCLMLLMRNTNGGGGGGDGGPGIVGREVRDLGNILYGGGGRWMHPPTIIPHPKDTICC